MCVNKVYLQFLKKKKKKLNVHKNTKKKYAVENA